MSTFRLTSDKIKGHILLNYHGDYLSGIQILVEGRLTDRQYESFLSIVRYNEYTLKLVGMPYFKVEPIVTVEPLTPVEKIALFCNLYKEHYHGLSYKVSPRDAGQMKSLQVDAPLLKYYFKSTNFLFKNKHSIRNLVTYTNELRAEYAGLTKEKFPPYWCNELWNAISDHNMRRGYLDHLHKLGIKNPTHASTK